MRSRCLRAALVSVALACCVLCAAEVNPGTNPWPQWRGPERDNVSNETGLLKTWPDGGPPLVWELRGIGAGIAAMAVAGGRIYALGYIGDTEYLTALDERTGQRLWLAPVGPNTGEMPLMRWLGQRTPTVDGDRVYAFHNKGPMVCFETKTGKELWRKDFAQDYGMNSVWKLCDRPLVDGDKLIVKPGGKKATLVALNKLTGEVIWEAGAGLGTTAHAATVIGEGGGVRQYVALIMNKAVSFRASDGKLLWTHAPFGRTGVSCTPIVWKDHVFLSAGFGEGVSLLKLSPDADGVKKELVYALPCDVSPFQDSALKVGAHVYGLGGKGRFCIEAETGKVAWLDNSSGPGKGGMTYADGHLYILHLNGAMALVEATPQKFNLKSTFMVPNFKGGDNATNPVIANGRLYLRQEDRLFCHDIRATEKKDAPPKPELIVLDAPQKAAAIALTKEVYVPTPQDIVEKMLELAEVKNTDVVFDLGSGDGRFVFTAAKRYGCKSIGYEYDEELVALSKQNVEKADVKALASIEHKDVLTLDLSSASVITVYFSEQFLEKLKPQFEKLKPGSRIVSHQFKIPGVAPDKTIEIISPFDGVKHAVYLWTVPLKKTENLKN